MCLTVNDKIARMTSLCSCDIDITTDMTVWDGVVVTPSDKAYEKKEAEEESKEAATEEKMDVQEK